VRRKALGWREFDTELSDSSLVGRVSSRALRVRAIKLIIGGGFVSLLLHMVIQTVTRLPIEDFGFLLTEMTHEPERAQE
jgi:hypothetical protein